MISVLFGIAHNTWKQFVRDRIFYLVLIVAAFLLGFSYLLATLTIVESRKILLDFCFSAVSLSGAITAIFLGVVAIAKEIEQKTIYTVVTKPLSRATYVIGKFLGSLAVLFATQFFLALTVMLIIWEMGEAVPPGYQACNYFIFLESAIVLACAFLCSAFASTVLAASLTSAFFLIGRSNSSFLLIKKNAQTWQMRDLTEILYAASPNLERFNIRDVVAYGHPYPHEMLWIGTAYAFLYIIICLTGSCLIVRSRDLP